VEIGGKYIFDSNISREFMSLCLDGKQRFSTRRSDSLGHI
jgi:hypothetical protein